MLRLHVSSDLCMHSSTTRPWMIFTTIKTLSAIFLLGFIAVYMIVAILVLASVILGPIVQNTHSPSPLIPICICTFHNPYSCIHPFISLPNPSFVPFLKAFLLLSRVPTELPTDAIHPVLAPPSFRLHRSERIPTRTDGYVVARLEFDTFAAVKAGPRRCPRIVRHSDTQNDRVGEDDGSER